jgi:hypothetical protein
VFLVGYSECFRALPRLLGRFAQPDVFVLQHRSVIAGEHNNGFGVQACGSSKLLRQLSPYLAAMDTVFFVAPVAALF